MSAPYQRVYDVRLQTASPPDSSCTAFNDFVKRKAVSGREMLNFSIVSQGAVCEVELKVRCDSCGRYSLNRFRRDLVVQFPGVLFVRYVRNRQPLA